MTATTAFSPNSADDCEVAGEVRRAALDRRNAAVGLAAVMRERADGGDEHDRARAEPARAADDVEELLHAHVGAEAALGDDVVAELQRHEVGDERVVAVRDVRERAAVDEGGLPLERLHEVRLEGVLEQHRHRPRCVELLRGHRLALPRVGDGDRAQALPQVVEVACHRRDRHHLRGGGDVEAGLAHVAVCSAAETDHDAAQRAVVHVHAAPPRDGERVDAELVAVQQVGLEHRREQVVRGADRVDVAGEVEVEVLHRHDLRVAAARRAALDPEHRAERRLAEAEHRPLADLAQALRQRDRRRRLALARLRGRDRRDADELRVGLRGQPVEHGQADLCLVVPVELDLSRLEADLGGDLRDRPQLRGLGDLEAREHAGIIPSRSAGIR